MKENINLIEKLRKHKSQIIFWAPRIVTLVLIVSLTNSCRIIKIKENERGVRFERFNGGLNLNTIYGTGLHLFPIWDKGIIYNVDTITQEEHLYLSTIDDIRYEINLVLKYKLVPDRIGYIESSIGKNYYDLVIIQEVENAFSNHLTKQTSNFVSAVDIDKFQSDILETVSKPIRKKYIKMISIKINQISKLE